LCSKNSNTGALLLGPEKLILIVIECEQKNLSELFDSKFNNHFISVIPTALSLLHIDPNAGSLRIIDQ
jgi:hypothetical protein